MRATTVDGDTVSTFLYRHLGSDSDTLEREFFLLNPSAIAFGPVFPSNLTFQLPALKSQSQPLRTTRVPTAWD